jgi:hypothetical protein
MSEMSGTALSCREDSREVTCGGGHNKICFRLLRTITCIMRVALLGVLIDG